MAEKPVPDTTPPDGTRHGPVPPMQPGEIHPDPGRKPVPNPQKPGDNPVMPSAQNPATDDTPLDD